MARIDIGNNVKEILKWVIIAFIVIQVLKLIVR
jgi:hypothetical protein